jgi:hypothetical protein
LTELVAASYWYANFGRSPRRHTCRETSSSKVVALELRESLIFLNFSGLHSLRLLNQSAEKLAANAACLLRSCYERQLQQLIESL